MGAVLVRPAAAQTDLAAIQTMTPDERAALLARLSDAEVRQLLLDSLSAGATPTEKTQLAADPAALIVRLGALFSEAATGFDMMIARAPELPHVFRQGWIRLASGSSAGQVALLLLEMLAILGCGYLAEWVAARWMRRRLAVPLAEPGAAGALLRLGLDLAGIALFTLVAVAVFYVLYRGVEPRRLFFLAALIATIFLRAVVIVSRTVLRLPRAPGRDASIDGRTASRAHLVICIAAAVGAYGFMLINWLRASTPHGGALQPLSIALGAVVVALVVTAFLQVRQPVAAALETGSSSRATRLMAPLWFVPFVVWLVVVYAVAVTFALVGMLHTPWPALATLFVPVGALLVDVAFVGLWPATDRWAEPLTFVFRRMARGGIWIAAALLLGYIWGLDLFARTEDGLAASVIRLLLDLGIVLLLAWILWAAIDAWILRRLRASEAALDGSAAPAIGSRLATILPLLHRFLQAVVIAIAIMLVLSSLGVDIGPLLAGAGIVGLAVGFGTQTLVRDLVSGLFFLMEDAFRVGEFVEAGDTAGTVERIQVRTLVLRHPRGALHTIPYGEISQLTNHSRDWVIMKLNFRLDHDTDLRSVHRIFKQMGKDLQDDPVLGPLFLEPLKSQGVMSMEDTAMVVRAKFKCMPGKQFQIRKEVYRRVQIAFREHGIEFAQPRVAVKLPSDVPPDEQNLAMAGAASVENAPR